MLSRAGTIDVFGISDRKQENTTEHRIKGMTLVTVKTNGGEVIWIVLDGDKILFTGSSDQYEIRQAKDGTANRWVFPRA